MARKKKIDNTSDRMAQFLGLTDFKLLKEQKTILIKLQAKLEKPKQKFTKKEWYTLEGIINFVDYIQDIAVDEYGYPARKVYRLSRGNK